MNYLSKSRQQKESGVALFAVMFTLLLLSVIGLAMMYATNTETFINTNYKDAQIALYASMSGLQEARDRIQPATHNIVAPTALPSLASANVIYIINPKGGETIAPWDMTNTYADTELCREKVLGLSGSWGVPCTTIASGSAWYSVVDNSNVSSAPWNLTTPTDTKWTRITVKGNNMTSVPANGDSAVSLQSCWDGHNQIPLPSGYGSNCQPDGSIATLTVNTPGSGYLFAPAVTISAPPAGGTQATADAVISHINNGQVESITVDAHGEGYVVAPTVTISGDGTGAAAVAVIGQPDSPVQSVTLNDAGTQCYSVAPSVTISGGGGSGANATSTLSTTKSCVVGWTPSAHCTSTPPKNTTLTVVTLSGGSGSGFTGTLTFNSGGHIGSSSIQDPGTGFVSNPTTAGGGSPALGSCVVTPNAIAGYRLNSLTLTSSGGGYTSAPSVSIGTGAGTTATSATATATLGAVPGNAGQVTAINMTAHGTGYNAGTTFVTLTGAATTNASASPVLGITYVSSLTLTNPGKGYLAAPTVTLSGGGGSGATATAKLGRGPNYGMVHLLTSLAQTRSGARAMVQMEVASPVLGYATTGALTLDGPSPILGALPNSNPYFIRGTDGNSCAETAEPAHPAIDGYDDPNADPPTHSVQTIVTALPRPDHYTGAGGTPSVQNGFESLGDTMGSPIGLKALIDAVRAAPGAHVYGNAPGSISMGTSSSPSINYIEGNLTLSGAPDGYGVLVVTGTLVMSGDFHWHGVVLVVGDGIADLTGGGNAEIIGTVIVAKIWDGYATKNLLSALGSPAFGWNGGGGNGIQYDHCWSDNLMEDIPFNPPPSTRPLKNLSTRTIP